ncbi:COX assembly mitochondrial protein 2 homolog [Nematostella vectensis]|uniref:COX assembly mitochondrial protein 2 homolog n=1 Tax=Nematostella vectensis TaxID=45351 RepID=UPI0013904831|nr:COX assembly mitochondrial protein 2 homolog [Nematostella vectensis]
MHPSLAPHLHDTCLDLIEKLHQCHEESGFKKFLGGCNDIERELQKCLKRESAERRRQNMEMAALRKEKFKKVDSEI